MLWKDDEEIERSPDTVRRIADKWSVLVVALLRREALSFDELHRSIEMMSERALQQTLEALERDGLVRPPSSVRDPDGYELTPLGRSLPVRVHALPEWADANHDQLIAARDRYDAVRPSEPESGPRGDADAEPESARA